MSAIDDLFKSLRSQRKKALMPFVTAGDPDLNFTAELLRTLDQCGANLCEVGIPYSDPIADGPVIQASYTRALEKKITLAGIFQTAHGVAAKLKAPLVSMVSYAIVYRHGLAEYVRDARAAGFAGAIVPDLPVEESSALLRICRDSDFSLIQLVTPTTPRDRAVKIAESSTGFLYFVSVTGITGERRDLPPELVDSVGWLRERTTLPICVGFGISQPEHIRMLAPVADGFIVGSALVRRIAEAGTVGREATLSRVREFVGELLEAVEKASG